MRLRQEFGTIADFDASLLSDRLSPEPAPGRPSMPDPTPDPNRISSRHPQVAPISVLRMRSSVSRLPVGEFGSLFPWKKGKPLHPSPLPDVSMRLAERPPQQVLQWAYYLTKNLRRRFVLRFQLCGLSAVRPSTRMGANGPDRPFAARHDAAPRLPEFAVHARRSNPTLERSALRTNALSRKRHDRPR